MTSYTLRAVWAIRKGQMTIFISFLNENDYKGSIPQAEPPVKFKLYALQLLFQCAVNMKMYSCKKCTFVTFYYYTD